MAAVDSQRAVLLERYAAAPDRLEELVASVPAPALTFKPTGESWSVQQIVVHLADNEVVDFTRARMALSMSAQPIVRYDEAEWASDFRYEEEDIAPVLTGFRVLRTRTLRLIRAVPGSWWVRSYLRPEGGQRTLDQWLEGTVGHFDEHMTQARRVLAEAGARPS
jgi:hypothetical protein